MRNRSIPFGYHYQNGIMAVHPQESQTVRAVFMAYLSGEPLSKIAAHLTAKLVEYLPGCCQWNKARVKRILDNAKYISSTALRKKWPNGSPSGLCQKTLRLLLDGTAASTPSLPW